MKLLSEISVRIKRGFLPHLTNELYKRGCEMRSLAQLEQDGGGDLFAIEVQCDSMEGFAAFLERIGRFSENFELVSVRNALDELIEGGLLRVSGAVPLEQADDFDTKILGATALLLERAASGGSARTGIARNIAVVSGVRAIPGGGTASVAEEYVRNERDALVVSRFAGLNAYPLVIVFDHIEDFVKSLRAIEGTFAAVRISSVGEVEDPSGLEQVSAGVTVPLVTRDHDETPTLLLAVIDGLSEKNGLERGETSVGFAGIDCAAIRLTHLLAARGYRRILGCDASETLMLALEKAGGLATTLENIFGNADIVVLGARDVTEADLRKIRPGQLVISLVPVTAEEEAVFRERGVRAHVVVSEQHRASVLPGLLMGAHRAGLCGIDDGRIIAASRLLVESASPGAYLPELFGGIHDRLAGLISAPAR